MTPLAVKLLDDRLYIVNIQRLPGALLYYELATLNSERSIYPPKGFKPLCTQRNNLLNEKVDAYAHQATTAGFVCIIVYIYSGQITNNFRFKICNRKIHRYLILF